MTNASIKNTFSVLFVFGLSIALSMGAFAIVAHAEEDLGYYDSYGDNLGYYDSYGDNLGYYDSYGDNLGYYDSYGDNLGYYDSYGDNLGYYDSYGDNLGYYDSYGDVYGTDVYGTDVTEEYGVGYSYHDYSSSGCGSSCGGGGFGGFSFAPPRMSFPAPGYPSYYPAPQPRPQQQQQQQQQQGGGPINIVNTNTNVNTNVNTAPVTPVYQTPVTYPVQYVYPQTYPTYYTPTYYPTYQSQPYCTITISNSAYGNYGSYSNQLATLSWTSSNATSAYISPNVGSVSTYGSRTVYPIGNQVYTMTVTGPGGSATCQTTSYYTPTPYVSLSQIPYTGFDFGPVGNALYWLSLLSFAVAGAYLLVYYYLPRNVFGKAGRGVALAASPMKVIETTAKKIDRALEPMLPARLNDFSRSGGSPFQNLPSFAKASEGRPVGETRNTTTDAMVVMHSKDGSAPRIVITRN